MLPEARIFKFQSNGRHSRHYWLVTPNVHGCLLMYGVSLLMHRLGWQRGGEYEIGIQTLI